METLDQELIQENFTQYRQASKGKRFANFLIDMIVFYIFLMILGFTLGILQVVTKTDLLSWTEDLNPLVDRLMTMLLYAIYYCLVEGIFKGRTLGKLITKTRTVGEDGLLMNTSELLNRSFSRIIPFDQLSFAFADQGWHDRFSHTMVVDLNDPILPVQTNIPDHESTPEGQ